MDTLWLFNKSPFAPCNPVSWIYLILLKVCRAWLDGWVEPWNGGELKGLERGGMSRLRGRRWVEGGGESRCSEPLVTAKYQFSSDRWFVAELDFGVHSVFVILHFYELYFFYLNVFFLWSYIYSIFYFSFFFKNLSFIFFSTFFFNVNVLTYILKYILDIFT